MTAPPSRPSSARLAEIEARLTQAASYGLPHNPGWALDGPTIGYLVTVVRAAERLSTYDPTDIDRDGEPTVCHFCLAWPEGHHAPDCPWQALELALDPDCG